MAALRWPPIPEALWWAVCLIREHTRTPWLHPCVQGWRPHRGAHHCSFLTLQFRPYTLHPRIVPSPDRRSQAGWHAFWPLWGQRWGIQLWEEIRCVKGGIWLHGAHMLWAGYQAFVSRVICGQHFLYLIILSPQTVQYESKNPHSIGARDHAVRSIILSPQMPFCC